MPRRPACAYLVPAGIVAGHALIWLASASAARAAWPGAPGVLWPLLPLSACILAAMLLVAAEAVWLVGGPEAFFCGGHEVVRELLGRGRATPPSRVVSAGPYAVSRHPVYTAALLAYVGLAASYPAALPGLAAVAAWVYLAAVVEEGVNARSPEYRAYASRVPRMNPAGVLAYGLRRCLHAAARRTRP